MKRALRLALRSFYILPAIGVLFGGDVLKHNIAPGSEGLIGPKEAEADIPYSQSSYYSQNYYQESYSPEWSFDMWQGDCPTGDGDGDSGGGAGAGADSPDACC